jgi:hypothetical protein
LLDPVVIEKIFDVDCGLNRTCGMGMQRWRRVRGKRYRESGRKITRRKKAGYAGAARRIGLQDVHGLGLQHAAEVKGVVSILTGRYAHAGRGMFPNEPKAIQIIRRHRFLEPGHAKLGEL